MTSTRELEARLRAAARSSASSLSSAPPVPASALAGFRRAAEEEGLIDVAYAVVGSPVGELVVVSSPAGVLALSWDAAVLDAVAERVSPRVVESPARLDDARRQLDEYFAGRRTHFDLPVDFALSKGFRQQVLRELAAGVAYGHVVTYGQLAARVGNPGAVRAVGSAMATNPIPIIVPCHRVVRTGGGLGNYSGRDGVVTKRYLLDLEGADPHLFLP